MLHSRLFSVQDCFRLCVRQLFRKIQSPEASRHSFIVLPEVPKGGNNPINLDNIRETTAYDIFVGSSRVVLDFDCNLTKLAESIKPDINEQECMKVKAEFDQLMDTIDKNYQHIRLHSYLCKDEEASRIVLTSLTRKLFIAHQQAISMDGLANALDTLLHSSTLDSMQKYSIKQLLNNWTFYGWRLSDEDRGCLQHSMEQLLNGNNVFSQTIIEDRRKRNQFFNRNDFADETPSWLLEQLKVAGGAGYQLNVRDHNLLDHCLRYCCNATIRNQIWLSSRQVSGSLSFDVASYSNQSLISEIRRHRKDIAAIHGSKSYADMLLQFQYRSPRTVDEIIALLETYKDQLQPTSEHEHDELVQYATKHLGLKESTLRMWDYEFVNRQFQTDVVGNPWASIAELDCRFDLRPTVDRLFSIMRSLFGISFIAEDNSAAAEEFSYTVSNVDGKPIGTVRFLVNHRDSREGIYTERLIDATGGPPVIVCVVNRPRSHTTFYDFQALLYAGGRILQLLMGNVSGDMSGLLRAPPPDCNDMASMLLIHLSLSSPLVLRYLLPGFDMATGTALCDSFQSNVLTTVSHLYALEKLYRAYFDVEICLSDRYYVDVQRELWRNFFGRSQNDKLFYQINDLDDWPATSTEIFSGGITGGLSLYSVFWKDHTVRMISNKFKDAGFLSWNPAENKINQDLRELLERFMKVFVVEINSRPPSDILPAFSK